MFRFCAVHTLPGGGIEIYKKKLKSTPTIVHRRRTFRLRWLELNPTFRRELFASATDRQCCSGIKLHQMGFLLCTYCFCCEVLSLTARFMTLTATNPNSNHTVPPLPNSICPTSQLLHFVMNFLPSSEIRARRQFCMLIATLKLRWVEISEKSSDKFRLVLVMRRERFNLSPEYPRQAVYEDHNILYVNLISLAF